VEDQRTGLDIVIGAVVGAIAGAVAALNLMAFSGVGYDLSITELLESHRVIGVLVISLLVAGPIGGVLAIRYWRTRHPRGCR